MHQLASEGVIKSIGVSNYNIDQLKELIDETGIVPSVNQVPISPFSVQTRFFHISHNIELIEYCQDNDIVVQAYSPLTRGAELNNPSLLKLAEEYNKTPAQVLLRWGIQKGLVVIPKSQNKERIEENINIFDFNISPEDMKIMNQFGELQ
jgi:diketogulonate reductase-like aldo/keto reductase